MRARRFWPHAIGITAAVLVPAAVVAAVAIPNTFTAGTSISAAQVNANFVAIRDYINTKFRFTGSVAAAKVTKNVEGLVMPSGTVAAGTAVARALLPAFTAPENTNCLVTLHANVDRVGFVVNDLTPSFTLVKDEGGVVVAKSALREDVGKYYTPGSGGLGGTSGYYSWSPPSGVVVAAFPVTAGKVTSFGCQMETSTGAMPGTTFPTGSAINCTISYICQ